jgi:hypothetical protein
MSGNDELRLRGPVVEGKRIASGQNPRYGFHGTIRSQMPFFESLAKEQGRPLPHYWSTFYPGTLNVVHGFRWTPTQPDWYFDRVTWFDGDRLEPGGGTQRVTKVESFFLIEAILEFGAEAYNAMVYLPDPRTKESPDANEYHRFEMLAPWIDCIGYGDEVVVRVNASKIEVLVPTD